jgi:hypothetical protein
MRCVVGLHLYLSTACRKLRHSTCASGMYWEVSCHLRMIMVLCMCLCSQHPFVPFGNSMFYQARCC